MQGQEPRGRPGEPVLGYSVLTSYAELEQPDDGDGCKSESARDLAGSSGELVIVLSVIRELHSARLRPVLTMIAPFLFVFADRISAASTRLAEKRGTSLGGIRIDKWDITQVAPVTLPPFADKLDYRVLPTHLLQVDFESALNNSATFVVQIAREADRWYVVAACPKPETKAAAEATRQARVKRAGRVRDFAAGIKPQQRETVLRLVREDRS